MGHSLSHRGPDDFGFLTYSPADGTRSGRECPPRPAHVGFAHRRLSIIDLSSDGWQPQTSRDGTHHVAFNGEIYNYRELRSDLSARGHRFSTSSDTEVLVAALSEWGAEAFKRFVGMYAVAWLDLARQHLVLARDPFGIKPLYYTNSTAAGISFASEPQVLLPFLGTRITSSAARAAEFLRYGYSDGTASTLFDGIGQVLPGSFLDIPLQASSNQPPPLSQSKHSEINPRPDLIDAGFDEAAAELRRLLIESVELHLRADVPVCAALSGGIDSSSLVCLMREVGGPGAEIHTFTYAPEDERIDESRWATLVSEFAATTSHLVRATPDSFLFELDALVAAQGLPIGGPTVHAGSFVFQAMQREGIKVALNGQGADELFGGYPSYFPFLVASRYRDAGGGAALAALRSLSNRSADRAMTLGARSLGVLGFGKLGSIGSRLAAPGWIRGAAQASPPPWPMGGKRLNDVLKADMETTRLPTLLRYEDRNSMQSSVESRVPFLTPAIASFALGLPERFLISESGTTKAVLREAMRGIVPDTILARTEKIGFATPDSQWIASFVDRQGKGLDSTIERLDRVVKLPGLKRALGRARNSGHLDDSRIWRAISLARWAEVFDVEIV